MVRGEEGGGSRRARGKQGEREREGRHGKSTHPNRSSVRAMDEMARSTLAFRRGSARADTAPSRSAMGARRGGRMRSGRRSCSGSSFTHRSSGAPEERETEKSRAPHTLTSHTPRGFSEAHPRLHHAVGRQGALARARALAAQNKKAPPARRALMYSSHIIPSPSPSPSLPSHSQYRPTRLDRLVLHKDLGSSLQKLVRGLGRVRRDVADAAPFFLSRAPASSSLSHAPLSSPIPRSRPATCRTPCSTVPLARGRRP